MNRNQTALLLGAQIDKLRAERNATQDQAKRAAADEAIQALQATRAQLIVAAADEIGLLVDQAIADLQAVQNREGVDAISALDRALDKLREARGA